jgi:hypothetical protein
VLRKAKLWSNIEDDVVMLKERTDIGRELSDDEIHRLLTICKGSVSRGLYPAVLTSLHIGLRSQELRLLRWHQVDLIEGIITVGKSKTAAGEGRLVYLSGLAVQTFAELAIAILGCAAQPCGVPKRTIRAQRKEGIIWRPGRALRDVSRQAYPKLCEGMEDRQESGRRRMPLARSAALMHKPACCWRRHRCNPSGPAGLDVPKNDRKVFARPRRGETEGGCRV